MKVLMEFETHNPRAAHALAVALESAGFPALTLPVDRGTKVTAIVTPEAARYLSALTGGLR